MVTLAMANRAATASSRALPVGMRPGRGSSHHRRPDRGAKSGTPDGVQASAATWAP